MATAKTARDVIVTVHGTFASAETDTGPQWWQKESKFTEELQKYWPENRTVEIRPLRWSGYNNDEDRNDAAKDLRKLLAKLLKTHDQVFVIGHSHGGNIITSAIRSQDNLFHAIERGIKGKGLEEKLTFVTVGTPFLSSVRDRPIQILALIAVIFLFFNWLAIIAQRLYPNLLSPIDYLLGDLATWTGIGLVLDPSDFKPFIYAECLVGFFSFLAFSIFLSRKRRSKRNLDPTVLARNCCVSLYDQSDEVFGFFKRSMRGKFPIVPKLLAAEYIVYMFAFIFVVTLIAYAWGAGEVEQRAWAIWEKVRSFRVSALA
jgi:Putative serine esterase (DUF676)